MEEEKVLVRMQSPPMMFWDMISVPQWDAMTDEAQDRIIESAKRILEERKNNPDY